MTTPAPAKDWARLPGHARERASARAQILAHVEHVQREQGLSESGACAYVAEQAAAGRLPHDVQAAAQLNSSTGRGLSRSNLLHWLADRRKGGAAALATRYKGRGAARPAWAEEAIDLYRQPQSPGFAWVARRLQERGHPATYAQVRTLIQRLPVAEQLRGRLSKHERINTVLGFLRRDLNGLEPNNVWMADGHTVDVRVLHPQTGKLFRPELTVWFDVASRMVTAAFLGEKENRLAVAWAFSRGIRTWGVPDIVYTDNGAGYVAADLADEAVGLFARAGSTHKRAKPYSGRSKAPLERWFGVMENDFGRRWPTYCGQGMSPDAERRIVAPRAADRDRVVALYPTFADYWAALQQWITHYNTERVHAVLRRTPYEVWRDGVGEISPAPAAAMMLPRVERTVSRNEVRFEGRIYSAPELQALHQQAVWMEYDPWDSQYVRILERPSARWVCDARIVRLMPTFADDEIASARRNKRSTLEDLSLIQADEDSRRALADRTYDEVMDSLAAVAVAGGGGLPPKTPGAGVDAPAPDAGPGDVSLDLYRTDY
ncbi:Mu transposase C-terminal domain-containing protein [Aquabacterium sp.]|uniref:Mu transposase C-terminal domain-containing protein n=1 Tax=Aquabacterium sp. TaxID=1872578 RepID=UPI0025B91932|nr:Mu transposase C-terminal domain-containing protein [Aquabacterium sp.]